MLTKFHTFLEPGGSVFLDVYSLKAFEQREETAMYETNLLNGFWSPNKYYGFLNTFKYEREKVVLDKYTLIEADRTRTVYNWLQYFSPEELEREFVEGGFTVEERYSGVAGSPFDSETKEFAVVAKKYRKGKNTEQSHENSYKGLKIPRSLYLCGGSSPDLGTIFR